LYLNIIANSSDFRYRSLKTFTINHKKSEDGIPGPPSYASFFKTFQSLNSEMINPMK